MPTPQFSSREVPPNLPPGTYLFRYLADVFSPNDPDHGILGVVERAFEYCHQVRRLDRYSLEWWCHAYSRFPSCPILLARNAALLVRENNVTHTP